MGEVELLGTYASFPSARIIWALKLKGVPFKFIEEDLLNKSDLLMKMNPVHKKVPVLIHNDNPISESLVILEYIDDTWKTICPLMPDDPYDRALARFWAKYVDDKCVVSAWEAMRLEGKEKEVAIVSAQQALEPIEKQIERKKFFGGDKIGYLDIVVGWISLWLAAMEEVGGMKVLDSTKFPRLSEWTHSFTQVPAIQHSLPPKETVVNYFQGGLNYMRSLNASKNQ